MMIAWQVAAPPSVLTQYTMRMPASIPLTCCGCITSAVIVFSARKRSQACEVPERDDDFYCCLLLRSVKLINLCYTVKDETCKSYTGPQRRVAYYTVRRSSTSAAAGEVFEPRLGGSGCHQHQENADLIPLPGSLLLKSLWCTVQISRAYGEQSMRKNRMSVFETVFSSAKRALARLNLTV